MDLTCKVSQEVLQVILNPALRCFSCPELNGFSSLNFIWLPDYSHKSLGAILECTDCMKISVNALHSFRLVHVSDAQPGIRRKRRGKSFVYLFRGKNIRNPKTLIRIRKLTIPPAWKNVWICAKENGHLQATGYDVRGRKQYRYHTHWNETRNENKFQRLLTFGKVLGKIRARIKNDLLLPGLPLNKVLATIIAVMDKTGMRIGSNEYEKLYGSYGVTTMKDKHVNVRGMQIRFSFAGKKGVRHLVSVHNKKLANVIKQCRDIPGQELFQYLDENGNRHPIDSGMVNAYIHEIAGEDFTSKDFRLWNGTLCAFTMLCKLAGTELKKTGKTVTDVYDTVAKQLGNTRAVCKKYYVHPVIIELYQNNTLEALLAKPMRKASARNLAADEKRLLHVLEKATK